jgi:ABC-type branched-subunit amino acid transport system ATPase component
MSLLALERLEVSYGGIRAVKGIDLAVEPGELVSAPTGQARPPR